MAGKFLVASETLVTGLTACALSVIAARCQLPREGELFLWRESKPSGLKASLTMPSHEAPPFEERLPPVGGRCHRR